MIYIYVFINVLKIWEKFVDINISTLIIIQWLFHIWMVQSNNNFHYWFFKKNLIFLNQLLTFTLHEECNYFININQTKILSINFTCENISRS